MNSWVDDIEFERVGILRRTFKTGVIDPLANHLPCRLLRSLLRFCNSEVAKVNWADPGGWRSMVIAYDERPKRIVDKILVGAGTMPKAIRNRRRLAARLLAELIRTAERQPPHLLCLAAGAGQIEMDALTQARRAAHATLVDLNRDALDYGRDLAGRNGLSDKVRFIRADVLEVERLLDDPPDIVTLLGICEYLSDDQIVAIARAAAAVMPAGAPIVFNSLSEAHGTDRFFRRVFGLHMNHRSPEQIGGLLELAGFTEGFAAIPEPLGVYHVATVRKDASTQDSC